MQLLFIFIFITHPVILNVVKNLFSLAYKEQMLRLRPA